MDWLTFWAEVIKATAWPLATLVILLAFRKPITDLIGVVQRLRFKDIELDFGRTVRELSADVNKALPSASVQSNGQRSTTHVQELAHLSPRAVVLESWLDVEEAAVEAARRHGLTLTARDARQPIVLGGALERAGVLDDDKQEIYLRLRNLRNAAVHASEFAFDANSALQYADAAARLADYLRSA
ncbi:MAG: hypothetical protein LC737_07400 [Chloroflexi bacterium]|nr:hypothetical protein [Chloroflexota bacterium]